MVPIGFTVEAAKGRSDNLKGQARPSSGRAWPLRSWALAHSMETSVGGYSDKEFFLDAPAAFVDFVIEAMLPELADYAVTV